MKKPLTLTERKRARIQENLKDRQAYRATLIHRMEELGAKLQATESQISVLRAA